MKIAYTLDIDDGWVLELLDCIYDVAEVGYWGRLELTPGRRTFRVCDDEQEADVLLDGLGALQALAALAQGGIANQAITRDAQQVLLEQELGQLDSRLGDVLCQYALFGELVYG